MCVCVCVCVCAGGARRGAGLAEAQAVAYPCIVDTTSGPPHPLVPADRVLAVLQKGAQPHAFPLLLLLSYGLTRFVSDQCSALFVTPVRLASIVCCVCVFCSDCA